MGFDDNAVAVIEERASAEIAWPAPFQEIDRRRYGDTLIALARAGGEGAVRTYPALAARLVLKCASGLAEEDAMTMRALLLAFSVGRTRAFGGRHAFVSGVWKGEANYDSDGNFRDCTMTAQSEGGVLLGFVISRNLDWGVALVDDRWSLDVGSVEDVALAVDLRKPIPAIAKVVDPHGILVPLENTDPVMKALRHGRKLTISTPSDRLSFELTGTNEALATLANCVSEHLQAEKASGGPGISAQAKPASENKANPNKLFTPAEAMTFAANLLASAGITDYQLVDPAENRVAEFRRGLDLSERDHRRARRLQGYERGRSRPGGEFGDGG